MIDIFNNERYKLGLGSYLNSGARQSISWSVHASVKK